MANNFQALMNQKNMFIKIALSMGISQLQSSTTTDYIPALISHRYYQGNQRQAPHSLESMANNQPLISQQLVLIQEKRCQNIGFSELAMLYSVGTIIYTKESGYLQAFVVSELSGMEQWSFNAYTPLCLRVWSIDHDGKEVCKRYQTFEIPQYFGTRGVSMLKFVPTGYLPEEHTRREELMNRGRRYWSWGSIVHHIQIPGQKVSDILSL